MKYNFRIICNLLILFVTNIVISSTQDITQGFYVKCKNSKITNADLHEISQKVKSVSQCISQCDRIYSCTGVNFQETPKNLLSRYWHSGTQLINGCNDVSIISENGIDCYLKGS